MEGLKHELGAIARRKKALKSLTNFQGYSLKTIKGHTYGVRWKCSGNIDKLRGQKAIKERL